MQSGFTFKEDVGIITDLNYYRSAGSVFRIRCSQIGLLVLILVSHHVENIIPTFDYTGQPLKALFIVTTFLRIGLSRVSH